MHLNHLPGPIRSVSWVCSESAISGMPCVSSEDLISGCDPPGRFNHLGSQEDLVSNWETVHSLVENPISGAKIAPCLLALAVASNGGMGLWWWDGPVHSRLTLLWYSLNPLFCEQAQLCLRLDLLVRKFFLSLSFAPLPPLAILQFGLLSHS